MTPTDESHRYTRPRCRRKGRTTYSHIAKLVTDLMVTYTIMARLDSYSLPCHGLASPESINLLIKILQFPLGLAKAA